jgi:PhnB protein
MPIFHPYLNFAGTTEEAFNFYKSVFGGEFTALMRFKDIPAEFPLPADVADKIMHISLPLGGGTILMATDSLASMGFTVTQGNNYHISINPDSKEDADRIYNSLSVGGKIETALGDQFWGAYFATFTDKFGTNWMISYEYPKA